MTKFKPGTPVVFEPKNFNPEYWDRLSEEDRLRYYGPLGYGQLHPKVFIFLCEILEPDGNPSGHCLLYSLNDQRIEPMRHTSDFRKATDEEI
jgi:hypothetical protein